MPPGSCGGTFNGTTALLVVGTSAGVGVPTSAAFSYTDDCVSGTAFGTITFSGGAVVVGSVTSRSTMRGRASA